MHFRVTDKEGTYLCAAWALVFEESVLAYKPTRDEAEWVPTHGITNDLSWMEERSAVVLANYVSCIPQEVAHITGLRAHCLVSWPNNSSSEEEDNGQVEEEDDEQAEEEDDEQEDDEPEGDEHKEDPADVEEQGEVNPEPSSGGVGLEQGEMELEAKPWR